MNRFNQRGFTLVEAMVAIVILTMTLLATYSWINVSIEMLIRTDEVLTQELLIDELMEEIYLTDIDSEPSGKLERGEVLVSWDAEPRDVKSSKNQRGITGFYDHTLYDIEVEVYNGTERVASYTTRQVTSRRVRDPRVES